MFLGQARGRVGSVVFSRRMGKQITRTYNAEPANPKTRAQALQRAQFATVIAASVGLKEVINNSFDGVKNGQESVNKFVSVNLSDLRSRAANGDAVALKWLVPKGQSFVQPQPWIISQGSIGDLKPGSTSLDIQFNGVGEDPEDPDYYAANASALTNTWYYKPGCQITFVALVLKTDPLTNERRIIPRVNRIIFNNLAPTGESELLKVTAYGETPYISAEYLDLTKTDLPVDDNRVRIPAYFKVNNVGGLEIDSTHYDGTVVGLGIITTYLENGVYRHTTSSMDFNVEDYEFTEDAVSTYMKQAQNIISSDYYTEQPATEYDDFDIPTLEQVVSSQIFASGMQPKGVYIGQSNSYGPVAEGSPVTLVIEVPARFQIRRNSVTAYNGETPLDNEWQIQRSSANRVFITGPMPTTTSFPFNVSFEVDDTVSGSHIGRAALRINVSKSNS